MDAWIAACQEFGAGSETTTRHPSPPITAPPRPDRGGRATLPVAMIEKRERKRRDGKTYSVYRVRWYEAAGRERSRTFDSRADAKAFEGKVRTFKRSDGLAQLDAGTETFAEFG